MTPVPDTGHPRPRRSWTARALLQVVRWSYAAIALWMRFMVARAVFLSGQAKIEGPTVPLRAFDGLVDFVIVLPAQVRDATVQLFATQYAGLPLSASDAAALFAYAEFVLPFCFLFGFGTRIAALALLGLMVLVRTYTTAASPFEQPEWLTLLAVLLVIGPGLLSLDWLLLRLARR